jgi:hypothetical protein
VNSIPFFRSLTFNCQIFGQPGLLQNFLWTDFQLKKGLFHQHQQFLKVFNCNSASFRLQRNCAFRPGILVCFTISIRTKKSWKRIRTPLCWPPYLNFNLNNFILWYGQNWPKTNIGTLIKFQISNQVCLSFLTDFKCYLQKTSFY